VQKKEKKNESSFQNWSNEKGKKKNLEQFGWKESKNK